MDERNLNEDIENDLTSGDEGIDDASNLQEEQPYSAEDLNGADNVTDELGALKNKYKELNDSHLRLMAEFDNYRKRTLREKAELIKNGGETTLIHLLPIIDDFERAMETIRTAEDIKAVAEGVDLIYTKFISYLSQQGVKPIEAIGKTFDTELFEAVAIIPAPEPDLKGKVLDSVQTGYTLHDKVIRHGKVVVAE